MVVLDFIQSVLISGRANTKMLLEIVTLVIAFLSTIYWLWTRNFDYWKVRGIPGPEPSLLYGNTKSVFLNSKTYTLEVEEIYK